MGIGRGRMGGSWGVWWGGGMGMGMGMGVGYMLLWYEVGEMWIQV